MGQWIALIGSAVIGSLALLTFQSFSNDVNREAVIETLDHLAYSNLDETRALIEYDFSRIGLGMNDPEVAIFTMATATEVRFKLDSDGNGVAETMRYYLSTTAAASATKNPNDRFLKRQINSGTAQTMATGLTDFKIQYFDVNGNETADLTAIRTLVVSLTMESNYDAGTDYPKLLWQGRFTPPSLVMF